MGNIINALKIAVALVPVIIETVKAIEVPGHGADKAATVVAVITAAFEELAPDVKATLGIDHIQAFTTRIIDIVVAFLNKVGVFNKG
jgi:hypothetical protein